MPNDESNIRFTFEGANYEAPMGFYDCNRCRLPDGRVLAANGWAESYPPQPNGLHVLDDTAPQAVKVS